LTETCYSATFLKHDGTVDTEIARDRVSNKHRNSMRLSGE